MKVLSAEQMRAVDRLTAERYGIPGIELMESAAARTVETAVSRFGRLSGRSALVVCGKGNNGGDGAAIARLLATAGANVELLLLGRVEDTRGDARLNFERAHALAQSSSLLQLVEIGSADQLRDRVGSRTYHLIFDAMLGTGLARPASGLFEEAINLINLRATSAAIVAVDIPSGISSDSAEVIGPSVRASLTVTFTAPKIGNVLPPASDYGGELVVAPIGSPAQLVESAGSKLNLVDASSIAEWLAHSRRTKHANKGDAGKVLIVAGSRGKTGAACLAGEAAMRAGAGLVTIASPASAQMTIASRVIAECMTEPLSETELGGVAAEAAERALALEAGRDVLVLGPGLGASGDSLPIEFVCRVVTNRTCPAVLDADGLNSLAPWPRDLRGEAALPLILTPHPGEMSRLLDLPIPEVVGNRIAVTREFAVTHGVILILKVSRTIIAAPDGEVYVNPTGNEGMATGGTGDVLAGVIGGLVAQKPVDPLGAAIAAVYLHGLAGDIAAARVGIRALIASDITAHLGDAFTEAGGVAERIERGSRQ